MIRISIIIPAYNSEHCLRETLEHALAQTAPAHEILVVDDGSTDRTAQIAQSFGNRVRYLRQANLGAAQARNHAIQQATGDWIAFLDHDDLFHPNKLKKQSAIAEAHPELTVIYSGFTYLHEDGTCLESPGFPAQQLWPALRYRTPILPSTAIVRRSALLDLGGFNTHSRYRRIEDWELWFRLIRRYSPAAFSCIPDSLLTYRVLPNSESKNVLPLTANALAMLEALLLDGLSPFKRFLWKRRIKARFLYHLSRSLREIAHPRSWEFAIESTLQWPFFGAIVPFARYRVFAHMLYKRLLGFQFNFRYWWPVRRDLDVSSEQTNN